MKSLATTFATLLFAAVMGDALIVSSQPAKAAQLYASADEVSAAKRYYKKRYVRAEAPRYSAYFKGPDPSLGPDGRPYRVPAHLRGQCYYDEGYGRFKACPNR